MSHIAQYESEVSDDEALKATAEAMGCRLIPNARPRFSLDYDRRENQDCEWVMQLPHSNYDLGFKRGSDGRYRFVCDNELMAGSYGATSPGRKLIGEGAANFLQEYQTQVARLQLEAEGYVVERTVNEHGVVELLATQ